MPLVLYFNPHHPQGGDGLDGTFYDLLLGYFNPHHPQGGDEGSNKMDEANANFNPHHPQGGDIKLLIWFLTMMISIHTTRKVVTVVVIPILLTREFQSTPPARW